MEEIYQITSALKHLSYGKRIAVITDARFSGVSTGACIGHVGPEALAGGPIGKLRDGDVVSLEIDRNRLQGSLDLTGSSGESFDAEEGARRLAARAPREDSRGESRPARRHPALGGAASPQRRDLERLRLRRRRHRRGAGTGWRGMTAVSLFRRPNMLGARREWYNGEHGPP